MALVGGLLAVAGSAWADGDIAVTAAWARPSFGQTGATALYLTLTNTGTAADELIFVSSPAARVSELHASREEGGIVKMQTLGSLPLPPGASVAFEPKGNHVMLMQLTHPLAAGEHIELELHFKTHPPLKADAIVSMAPPAP